MLKCGIYKLCKDKEARSIRNNIDSRIPGTGIMEDMKGRCMIVHHRQFMKSYSTWRTFPHSYTHRTGTVPYTSLSWTPQCTLPWLNLT